MKVMLAKKFENQDPKGWWMSEKLDGVRAIWNGRTLVSRNGNEFNAPDWFIDDLRDKVILDGELGEGSGRFQTTVGKVRAYNGDWGRIKFMVFDVVSEDAYEERRATLEGLRMPDHCRIVAQELCKDRQHLNKYESSILMAGGEGVMLRKFGSLYDHKRSSSLLKVKNFQTDEAVVTGYTEGQGKHAGIPDSMRQVPPSIGSLVTISFIGLTDAGKPREASLLTERNYE